MIKHVKFWRTWFMLSLGPPRILDHKNQLVRASTTKMAESASQHRQ